jgi:glycosyltransferase involved in cell wall biosynthesis
VAAHSKTKVSVLIPCRNEKTYVSAFLSSLQKQIIPSDVDCEFLLADGMSDDGTREVVESFRCGLQNLRVLDNTQLTVSCGLNAAIRAALGDIIIRMDVHSEYAPDYIQQCIVTLEETGAENVGGPALPVGDSYIQHAVSLAYVSRFSCGGPKFHDPNYEGYVDTVTYGCWRKATLERIGLFDESLTRNQDDELNLRLVRTGGKIWQTPRIRSWYRPRSTLKSLARQYSQYGYWKVRVIRKHGTPASWRHLVPAGFVAAVLCLCLMALVFPAARLPLAGMLLVYAVATFAASLTACRAWRDWMFVPVMPVVFCTFHLSYGIGFWRGIWDVCTGRSPEPAFTALVR